MKNFIRRSSSLDAVSFEQALRSETHAPLEGAEGFGCPFSERSCDTHCMTKGYRGGYCKGAVRQTCVCYK
ncbi:MAG: actinodefensin [Actinomyces succiniciruminis]|uniref:Arthropod defensin n=1 Tax=Actinomyces succiniciruminis TaxID=1522002 RepID=A0A1L7RLG2_9ACTO|nr:actinodefensin [Actinomyces succiniciruminis]MBE6475674.1 arthropod defensin [Actinomyces succiniciruminis]MBM6980125.1 actinodefensin [Actinomyces succiniciruminis]CED90094.1 Arthropod defensin [Actinomyces succiniciruminis]